MLFGVRVYTVRHWRVLVFAGVATAALVTALVFGGLVAAAPLVVTALSALLLRTGTTKVPRPRLALIPLRQPELWPATDAARSLAELFGDEPVGSPPAPRSDAAAIVGQRRPLAVDEIMKDAVRVAKAQADHAHGRGFLATVRPEYAPPSADDHRRFEEQVSEYADAVREWLSEVDDVLTARSRILVAEVQQSNVAEVDAADARVVARFPLGFAAADDVPEPPTAPDVPAFPRRRSALSMAMGGYDASFSSVDRPLFGPFIGPLAVQDLTLWEPDYQRRDGRLEVAYVRQPIRHGEVQATGDPLVLMCPDAGQHKIEWEVHAANLPSAARGTWTVTCVDEVTGDPVRSMVDLIDLLAVLSPGDGVET